VIDLVTRTSNAAKIINASNKRGKSILAVLQKYNDFVLNLKRSPDPQYPAPQLLDKSKLKYMDVLDEFWELDPLESSERWAIDPEFQKLLRALNEYDRAIEEVKILSKEVQRYTNSHASRLNKVITLLQEVTDQCLVRSLLVENGERSFCAPQSIEVQLGPLCSRIPVFLNKEYNVADSLKSMT
jgi:hypothetical protein